MHFPTKSKFFVSYFKIKGSIWSSVEFSRIQYWRPLSVSISQNRKWNVIVTFV